MRRVWHVVSATASVIFLAIAACDVAWSLISQGGLLLPLPVHSFVLVIGAALFVKWRIERRGVETTTTVYGISPEQVERDFRTLLEIVDR